MVKNRPAKQETQVWSLSREDPLEKEMAIHSSILAWEVPWTEVPGGLQSMGLSRVRHELTTKQQAVHSRLRWGQPYAPSGRLQSPVTLVNYSAPFHSQKCPCLEDKNVVTQTLHILFSVKLFPLVIETQWIQTHKSAWRQPRCGRVQLQEEVQPELLCSVKRCLVCRWEKPRGWKAEPEAIVLKSDIWFLKCISVFV